MSELVQNFHFLRPLVLLLLLVPAFFYAMFKIKAETYSNWARVCDSKLLQYLLVKGDNGSRLWNKIFWMTGIICGIVAAAGPTWKQTARPALASQNPIMILLNLSSDMTQTDVTPSRLVRAKIEITDLLRQIPDAESGLIVYTNEPFVISPLSDDPELIVSLLDAVDLDIMPANGDRLDRAVDLAVERIKSAGFNAGNIVVVSAEAGTDLPLSIEAARRARSENIFVDTISVSATDSPDLQKIAKAGGGIALSLSTRSARQLASYILQNADNQLKESANTSSDWQDFGYYLMFVTVGCFLWLFRKGAVFVLLAATFSSEAWAGWLWTDAYEAQNLYDKGQYTAAAEKFADPLWRGAAQYRAGDYQAAAQSFAAIDGTEALYNQGNAVAKAGQIEDAIKIYEEVLQLDPKHEDARFNLEYLKQQQNQQQQQQNQNQNEDQEQNQDQNQQQNAAQSGQSDDNQPDEDGENDNNEPDSSSGAQDENDNAQDQQQPTDANNEQNQPQGGQEDEQTPQEQQVAGVQQGDADDKFDEQVQAREQRFRDVPEDKGGLLRAFIRREYNKNRYGE